jgi:hypothetical protein
MSNIVTVVAKHAAHDLVLVSVRVHEQDKRRHRRGTGKIEYGQVGFGFSNITRVCRIS